MNDARTLRIANLFPRIRLFLALSRTPHGLLDMATPALCALLWLGEFPPAKIIVLGIITAFAGYTSVYALNDVVDYRRDKDKINKGLLDKTDTSMDAVLVRHPMAQGLLKYWEGFIWMVSWSVLAVVGAYILNPVCVLIFVIGFSVEIVYCALFSFSWSRTVVSCMVKTSGAIAAVFAVDPNPSPYFLVVLFLMLSFWEVGGQNIPNDYIDANEDKALKGTSIPLSLGTKNATTAILCSILAVTLLSLVIHRFTPNRDGIFFMAAFLLAGLYLLLIPAIRLLKSKKRAHAIELFNKASWYPFVLFIIVTVRLISELV
jgi:4-hydroxybenzoate polyprenyltransferase